MRTAALPNFRKLWRKVDHMATGPFQDGLPIGNYTINIENNFKVENDTVKKTIIIAEQSFMGAKSWNKGLISAAVGVFLGICSIILFRLYKREARAKEAIQKRKDRMDEQKTG
jgi:hypothetical protein